MLCQRCAHDRAIESQAKAAAEGGGGDVHWQKWRYEYRRVNKAEAEELGLW